MRHVLGLQELGPPLKRSAVTIGKFSAVHRGHQALLQATVAAAARAGGPSVALTFDRHPMEVLRPQSPPPPQMATLDERLELIAAHNVDVALVLSVTPEFLAQEPEDFVREVLVVRLGAAEVLTGEQFRFGCRARGDRALLERMGRELGFQSTLAPSVMDGGHRISSSRITACILAGQVADAERLLGRPYHVCGPVIRGQQLGRKLGFPTANIDVPANRMLPPDGIYVVEAGLNNAILPAVANLGMRPTVGGTHRLLEVYLLDWQGDLYDQELTIRFRERLRDELKFPNLEALTAQITLDVQAARAWFGASSSAGPAQS